MRCVRWTLYPIRGEAYWPPGVPLRMAQGCIRVGTYRKAGGRS